MPGRVLAPATVTAVFDRPSTNAAAPKSTPPSATPMWSPMNVMAGSAPSADADVVAPVVTLAARDPTKTLGWRLVQSGRLPARSQLQALDALRGSQSTSWMPVELFLYS